MEDESHQGHLAGDVRDFLRRRPAVADLWIDDPIAARDTGKRHDARARRSDPRVETQARMTATREHVSLVHLVCLVCLVNLVCFVDLVCLGCLVG